MSAHENDKKEEPVEAAMRQVDLPAPPERLERIFLEHHAQVLAAAYRVTGSATDAEDVLQTVFLRLLRRERGEGLSDTPASYLHRAAINAALDLVRNRKSLKATPLEDVAAHLAEDPRLGPERRRGDREIRARVREALGGLNPRTAEVFVLRYFEGYGNQEIARMLGASRSTVAVMLHRARSRLRKDIRRHLGETP